MGEIGPDLFRHACLLGLEGLVSKHREGAYRGGRSPRWIKVKNRQHPAAAMAAVIATERRLRMRMPGRELVVQNVVNWRTVRGYGVASTG